MRKSIVDSTIGTAFTSFWMAIFLALLCSCDTKFFLPEIPCPIPQRSHPENVRLALVLGGGGAKGMAHVGVLYEFEQAGIPIDVLIGCSAGSIVGALYADHPNACAVKKLLIPLRKWDILDINLWNSRYGFVRGHSLKHFLNVNLSCKRFEDLKIPLYVVATDLKAGELVTLNSGWIIPAVHASSAIPFLFCPVLLHDRMLVDGSVADPVPVQAAKDIGAKVIVAVDLSDLLPETCPTNLFGVARRSAEVKFLLQSASCVKGADVVIKPDLGDMGIFDDRNPDNVFEAGRRAAREMIPDIIELLETLHN